jgi:hypothetical protein
MFIMKNGKKWEVTLNGEVIYTAKTLTEAMNWVKAQGR